MEQEQVQYYMIDVPGSREAGHLKLWRWGPGSTNRLDEAAVLPEEAANKHVDLYDDGRRNQLILTDVVQQLSHDGKTTDAIPHNELIGLIRQINREEDEQERRIA